MVVIVIGRGRKEGSLGWYECVINSNVCGSFVYDGFGFGASVGAPSGTIKISPDAS